MNLGQLRKLISERSALPDNAPLLIPGSDHNYRVADVAVRSVSWSREHGTWNEDFGDAHRTEDEVQRVAIVID